MAHNHGGRPTPDLLQRLDTLVSAGRITPEQAERLRAAGDDTERQLIIDEIRAGHAAARVEDAQRAGVVSEDEARRLLRRLAAGEDPRIVRRLRPRAT